LDQLENLLAKITSRSATVGVIGLGYVGLPLALLFKESGFPVIGFDIDPTKPEALNRGESYIRHIRPERVADAFAHGRIQPAYRRRSLTRGAPGEHLGQGGRRVFRAASKES